MHLAECLSVIRGLSRADNPDSVLADREFKAIKPAILSRDKHKCQACGFVASKFQEVHHIDGDHANNLDSNLITTCRLCHLCEHVGWVGAHSAGTLIYAPEITQIDLNRIQRILWVGKRGKDKDIVQQCELLLDELRSFEEHMEMSVGFSSPLTLANELIAMDDDLYARRKEVIGNVRLLFNESHFEPQISYWSSSILKRLPTEKWTELTCNHLDLDALPAS